MFNLKIILLAFLSCSSLLSQTWKGSGTKEDPYQITTIREFQDIVKKSSKYFILMNDIDASETRNWNVGDHDKDSTTPDEAMGFGPIYLYESELNGNGFTISNLYMNFPKSSSIALFSHIFGSKIKKLGMVNCDITGLEEVASFCVYMEPGIIEECFSTGRINITRTTLEYVGSAFCHTNKGEIKNCYTECIVNCNTEIDYAISGFSNFNFGDWISSCYSVGKMNTNGKVHFFSESEYCYSCYWDTETTGVPPQANVLSRGFPTSEMYKQTTYIGFDFDKVWCIDEGKSYPKLRAFGKCPTGVEEKVSSINNRFSISPNPSSNFIELKVNSKSKIIKKVIIYDIYGTQVLEFNEKDIFLSIENKIIIDISILISGLYFIEMDFGVDKNINKIIINK